MKRKKPSQLESENIRLKIDVANLQDEVGKLQQRNADLQVKTEEYIERIKSLLTES